MGKNYTLNNKKTRTGQQKRDADTRFQAAQERLATSILLTVEQKLDVLDTKLGKGKGAKKQRERYNKQLIEAKVAKGKVPSHS